MQLMSSFRIQTQEIHLSITQTISALEKIINITLIKT
jgi:hypothetical protein